MNPDLTALTLKQLSVLELLQLEEMSSYRSSALRELSRRNPLELILALFPHQDIDWSKVSQSLWMTPELIVQYAEQLDWHKLSSNKILSDPNFPSELIDRFECRWDWNRLTSVVHLTPELVAMQYTHTEDMNQVSANPSLTAELIEQYADQLDWDMLCENRALPLELLKKNLDRVDSLALSHCANLTEELIQEWMSDGAMTTDDWKYISLNSNLTEELIKKHWFDLDWENLSENPAVSAAIMTKHGDSLYWPFLSSNPNLTEELIDQHWYELNHKHLSANPALSPASIIKYQDELRWKELSNNPAILPLIEQFLPWINDRLHWPNLSWMVLEHQPSLILSYPDRPWNFSKIEERISLNVWKDMCETLELTTYRNWVLPCTSFPNKEVDEREESDEEQEDDQEDSDEDEKKTEEAPRGWQRRAWWE